MATSMLELGVGTGKWDAGLKKAKQSLDNFIQANGGLQQALEKESQKMQKFVQMMGQMDSTAKTAKGQMNDYKATIEQLTMQYNRMSEAQKKTIGQDYLNSIDQIKEKYRQTKKEIEAINKSMGDMKMPDMKGGGFLSGIGSKMSGSLQVFAGNMYTKAAEAVANLGSEMYDTVKQGIELAKQGEGIRMAFERLGRGDLLDGLREATHGTVTDIELMKAAVKFNDFNLPLDQLGTMLAFAQQKAKDTGESVNFMVESITNGLGRQSKPILDNLGISAKEIEERMKSTGDFTKAVGDIIRDKMAKAGDYVETAADRAAQANVNLQNKMEELGRKFLPVQEASDNLFTSMKIAILDVVGGPLARLLNGLTEAGRLKNMLDDLNGGGNGKESQTEKALRILREYSGGGRGIEGKRDLYNRQVASYNKQEEKAWREANRLREELKGLRRQQKENGLAGNLQPLISETSRQLEAAENRAKAIQIMRANYQAAAKQILQPIEQKIVPTFGGGGSGGGGKGGKTEIEAAIGSIDYQTKKVQELQKAWQAAADDDSRRKIKAEIESAQAVLDNMTGKVFDPSKMKQIAPTAIAAPKMELTDPMGTVNTMKQSIKLELKTEAVKVDETTLQTMLKDAVQNGINGMDFQFNAIGKKIGAGLDVPDSAWEGILEQYNALREQIGLDPITIDFKTGNIKNVADDGKKLSKDWQAAGSAIQAVGSAMSQIEDPAAKVMGTIAQAIATMALSYAEASKQAAMNPANAGWGWIAFAATGLATMVSSIAAIKSATGYAQGGMIKGNSYSGDNIGGMVDGGAGGFVGLNAGEIVLNQAQTANVANALEGGGMRGIDLSARVNGEQIVLVANRYFKRTGQGEIVTWR